MRLVLARHGATANNAERRYTGQSDVPLSALGMRQASALALALDHEPFDLILASDLLRARQTAEAIAGQSSRPFQLDADLREISMGAWEGCTHAEIAAAYPEALARWNANPLDIAPPEGETLVQFRDRIASALERCFAQHPGGRVLWVTHGGLIGVLLCHLLRMPLTQRWQFRRDNCALTEVDVQPDRLHGIVMRLNDTSHLRDVPTAEDSQVM